MNNQKGYALLLVLGAVVIIGLLVPPMAYQIISSSSQASQTERNVQLENMYDMGKQMGRRHVETAVKGEVGYGGFDAIADATDGEVTWEDVENHFKAELQVEADIEPFKIDNLDFQTYGGSVDVKFTRVEEISDRLEIEYEVTPEINADASDTVTETFYLGREGGDGSEWLDDDGSISDDIFGDDEPNLFEGSGNHASGNVDQEEDFTNAIFRNGQLVLTNDNTANGPMAFGNGVEVRTPSNNGDIDINGDVYFADSIFAVYQNSKVRIQKNNEKVQAHFFNTQFEFKHDRDEPYIFIDGDVYDYGGNTFKRTQTEDFVKVENYEEVENSDVRREVYYTGELISVNPSFMTGLVLEGTRGE